MGKLRFQSFLYNANIFNTPYVIQIFPITFHYVCWHKVEGGYSKERRKLTPLSDPETLKKSKDMKGQFSIFAASTPNYKMRIGVLEASNEWRSLKLHFQGHEKRESWRIFLVERWHVGQWRRARGAGSNTVQALVLYIIQCIQHFLKYPIWRESTKSTNKQKRLNNQNKAVTVIGN